MLKFLMPGRIPNRETDRFVLRLLNMTQIELSAAQKRVISHRGGHLQVIACAGSGKTESVSRRVAALIDEGAHPASIVAFTFTEKAASELKERIIARVIEVKGEEFKGMLAQMFVGTIHAYCFKMLQDHVPRFGNYDVLEEHRHAGLLSREIDNLGLREIKDDSRHWQSIEDFLAAVDVIGNELITDEQLRGHPIAEPYAKYVEMLDRYHFLTFGLVIRRAVEALADPLVRQRVHGTIRHLIVDEYQDINPAQEALIRILGADPVQVCVVGDDDQSIYQWRGSDLSNILTFQKRYNATSVTLDTNRRSRPAIVRAAAQFASEIPDRLEKTMIASRADAGFSVNPFSAETAEDEAQLVADAIVDLKARGFAYGDIALLFRSVRTSAPPFIEALRQRGIPLSAGGRTGLFLLPEIDLLGRIYAWMIDSDWAVTGYGKPREAIDEDDLVQRLRKHFPVSAPPKKIKKFLQDWKRHATTGSAPAALVLDYYNFLNFLGVCTLDPDNPDDNARLGSLARFSSILSDFEGVTRRARFIQEEGEEKLKGGQDRGIHYYRRLGNYIQHYARDAYEDFDGEDTSTVDAVHIVTVHQSKGLEWPVVFLPSLTKLRFPSSMAGRAREWLLPESAFPREKSRRYEGGNGEERRLFYVAMTRARDHLYPSTFRFINSAAKPSPYLVSISGGDIPNRDRLPVPSAPASAQRTEDPKLAISFSELASFEDCGYRFRLSRRLGFANQLVSELGYGRSIHHVLRHIAEISRDTKRIPSRAEVEAIIDREFYLPFANRGNFEELKGKAARLVYKYVDQYRSDLGRIWATERPFELHLPHGILSGRADVILSHNEDRPDSLAVVDYKTVKGSEQDEKFRFQLTVYAAAGRLEQLSIDAALLHNLDSSNRTEVDISPKQTHSALDRVGGLMSDLRSCKFTAAPETNKCKSCEYRRLCRHAAPDPWEDD